MITSPKDLERKKKLGEEILGELRKLHPNAKIALKYGNNMQLLAAVIMSAQCTDKKVNEVTEKLFRKYKTVGDFAGANIKTFEKELKRKINIHILPSLHQSYKEFKNTAANGIVLHGYLKII